MNKEIIKLMDYEKSWGSIVWRFPEKIKYADATHCQSILNAMDKNEISMIVFDFRNTAQVHSSMIGFLILMKKKLIADGIEPVFIFSEKMCEITKTLYCYEWFMGEDNE